MWNTLYAFIVDGKASLEATSPTLSKIWIDPQNIGVNLERDPTFSETFLCLIQIYTWYPTYNSLCILLWFA